MINQKMYPIINIGPLALQTSPLILLFGLWLGLFLVGRYAAKYKSNENALNNLVFIALVFGIIGSRLFYIIRYLDIFTSNPSSIISINLEMFDPLGGIFTGLFAATIYGKRENLEFWNSLDALTPLLAVMTIVFPLSQFTTGASYGKPTGLPWSIDLWGEFRHPVQLYNVVISFATLVFIWPSRKFMSTLRPGLYFLIFITATSTSRIFVEGFSESSLVLPGGFRTTQVLFWFMLAFSLYWIRRKLLVDMDNS